MSTRIEAILDQRTFGGGDGAERAQGVVGMGAALAALL